MNFDKLISDIQEVIKQRLACYAGKQQTAASADTFAIVGEPDQALPGYVADEELNAHEQLVLAVAMIPHLEPGFFTDTIQQFMPQGGELPIFGASKAKYHRGVIPTGETLQFIIGGTNTAKRIQVAQLISQSVLIRKGVLYLDKVPEGEPLMSGPLRVSREYVDLFLTGSLSTPDFGPDFPAREITTERDWDDLVLTEDVLSQIGELKQWIRHSERLMEEWEMRKKLKPGCRVLFHGPSGTGKTMTATLLGKHTGRPVFRVDLSTIVSKYIGETEKNLEKLFARAQHKEWILFFDEADALFGKRTDVGDSHDRYANQEVSYLLQRVEDFGGLIILSTNYKSNIDDAFLRRFNAIVKFPFPDAALRRRIWEKSLPRKARLAHDVDLREIAATYKLSGGSIINAVQHASLQTLSEGSRTIKLESLLHAIRREVEKDGSVFNELRPSKVNRNGIVKP